MSKLSDEMKENLKVSFEKKKTSDPRQVTISKYQTFTIFNFEKLKQMIKKSKLKPNDNFGVINSSFNEENNQIRALFGSVDDMYFNMVEYKNMEIMEGKILGVLKNTILVEYFKNQKDGNLFFFTYGDPKLFNKVQEKHKEGFRQNLDANMVEFGHEKTRSFCTKFKENLKSISYEPNGQEEYGNTDLASVQKKGKTKGRKCLDQDAKIIKEVLFNGNILLDCFEGFTKLDIDEFDEDNSYYEKDVVFKLSYKGTLTLTLPEIRFSYKRDSNIIEKDLYDIVKKTYIKIVGLDWIEYSSEQIKTADQMILDFLEEYDAKETR